MNFKWLSTPLTLLFLPAILFLPACQEFTKAQGAATPLKAPSFRAETSPPPESSNPESAWGKAIQEMMDKELASNPLLPGSLLTVRAGSFQWSGAAGRFGEGDRKLIPTDLFRSASVTKTFVAAATLVLMEQGMLTLDTPIAALLRPATAQTLSRGGYAPDSITVRQLLGHTAGLFDYTETDTFNRVIFEKPTHRWTREEQLALAIDEGLPLGTPGERYVYGDTPYILLGEILEVSTGQTLAQALRALLRYDTLGMQDTWLETLEPAPPGALARLSHPLYGAVDTHDWDASWDLFGSGGIVSSTQDLVRFMDTLFQGKIFTLPSTLETMIDIPSVGEGNFFGIDGGMGINRLWINDVMCYGGYGFFGTELVHCPDIDVTFALTMNQSEPGANYDSYDMVSQLLNIVGH